MPQITVSDETFNRVAEFRRVIEAIIEGEVDSVQCAELVLLRGMDLMLAEFLAPAGPEALLMTVQKLGACHPAQVYAFIADALKAGMSREQKEEAKRQIGFHAMRQQNAGKQE